MNDPVTASQNRGGGKTKSRLLLFLLFIAWPFAGFLAALRNFGQKESRFIVYLFFILYGFTFIINSEGPDAARYAQFLIDARKLSLGDYLKTAHGFHIGDICFDFVQPIITFVVSRFTEDHRFLFAVFAAFFGWFYLRSIGLVYDQYRTHRNVNALVHLLFFVAAIPIFYINGFRFYTAAWVFFYGAYHVVLYGRKKYIGLCLCTFFVHFSFFIPNVILLIYLLFGNRNLIYILLFVASFFFLEALFFLGKEIAPHLGGDLQERVEMQISDAAVTGMWEARKEVKWFVFGAGRLVLYYLSLAIFVVRHQFNKIAKSKELQNLFSFTLLFLAFVNFGQGIPSFGVRYQTVAFLFAALFISLVFSQVRSPKWNTITLAGFFPMLLFSALSIRFGFNSMNFYLFAPMPLPLLKGGIPLENLYIFLFK